MHITNKGRYALRALIALGEIKDEGEPIPVHVIAERARLSSFFLNKILNDLKRAGLVRSTRGPGGGYRFARRTEAISLNDILEASGDELDFASCDCGQKPCRDKKVCKAESVWRDLDLGFRENTESILLSDIIARN